MLFVVATTLRPMLAKLQLPLQRKSAVCWHQTAACCNQLQEPLHAYSGAWLLRIFWQAFHNRGWMSLGKSCGFTAVMDLVCFLISATASPWLFVMNHSLQPSIKKNARRVMRACRTASCTTVVVAASSSQPTCRCCTSVFASAGVNERM